MYIIFNFIQRIKFKLRFDRKRSVLRYIKKNHCVSILEIGVFNGNFASRMISTAQKYNKNLEIHYVGVDLFESNFSNEIAVSEISLKPRSKSFVEQYLKFLNAKVELYEGTSSEILTKLKYKFDLIIIDGGHSYATVKVDFENSLKLLDKEGAIFFDDYTNKAGVTRGGFGINSVIHEIDKSKFKIVKCINRDLFWKPYGVLTLRMVRVFPLK